MLIEHTTAYAGYCFDFNMKKLIWNRGNLPKYYAEDTYPAIIDQVTFELAQSILQKRRVSSGTKRDPRKRYLFSSVIKCGLCGKKYKRKDRKGKVV